MDVKSSLKAILTDVQHGLNTGKFDNEAAVSQGIVLPILYALGWPIFDTRIVHPEYSVSGGRVDFALCHPPKKPLVFIEVKRVGASEGADRQLFEYAFHIGVPMAILTDGQEWHFYLPGEQGSYQERRVYKLDILNRDIDECVSRLVRYLDYEKSRTGDTIKTAKSDYRDVNERRQVSRFLPIAVEQLIRERDEMLIEVVSDKVESLCGYRPDEMQVALYLETLILGHTLATSSSNNNRIINLTASPPSAKEQRHRNVSKSKGISSSAIGGSKHHRKKKSPAPPKQLRVIFQDGTVIQGDTSATTLVETIRKIGVERVRSLGLKSRPTTKCRYALVDIQPDPTQSPRSLGDYYVHTRSSTPEKQRVLEQIQQLVGEIKEIRVLEPYNK